MKKIIAAACISLILWSCGGAANDGDPATDTSTTIPSDPAVTNPGSGATTINSNVNSDTGAHPNDMDTTLRPKNDIRSSSSAYPDGRGVKAKKDSARQ